MNTYKITRYGQTWTIAIDDQIMETNLAAGEPCEYHMLDWIAANIPNGGIWIDAGANVGNHAIPFSFKAELVIAYEPMPQNFGLLERNCAPHRRILPIRAGVGDRAGEMGAHLGGTGQNCQWILDDNPSDDGWRIPVVTIDGSIPEGREVRVIKLDVEGMEPQAISGAWNTIGLWRPELFIEIWDDAQLDRIRAVLATLGYKLIERWNHSPTYHFSASGRYPVTYTKPI